MKIRNVYYQGLFVLFLLTINIIVTAQTPAFPGAEGYGKYTSGGRGGTVYYVTTLEDNNQPGSLRYAVSQSGPRIVVFAVSGNIKLNSRLSINNGDITIAGQTAPGDGICIQDNSVFVGADNVIIRFVRFRMGDETNVEDDAMWGRRKSNIIIDHCSMSWSTDECASFYDNVNFTMQWCLLSESLRISVHDKGTHGYGGIWGGRKASFHHNLLAHHDSRNPRFCGSRYSNLPDEEMVDFRNNVLFNWGANVAYAAEGGKYNLINNYYKAGPASSNKSRIIQPYADNGGNSQPTGTYGQFYLEGNVLTASSSTTANNWNGLTMHSSSFSTYAPGVTKDDLMLDNPVNVPEVTTHSAENAYAKILEYVGASLVRDDIDNRIVNEVSTGQPTYLEGGNGSTNGLIDTQATVGGWPTLNTYDVPLDTDQDGIPDEWELANGLNPNDSSDGASNTLDSNYTNLEVYLNGLVSEIVEKQNEGGVSTDIDIPKTSSKKLLVYISEGGRVLNLSHPHPIQKVEIFNMNGQLVYQKKSNRISEQISLSGFMKGIYVVRVHLENAQVETSKFIVANNK
nr:T9SS type A sorting domain-containing protein [uncultured Carboxylicivirga sp.]